MLEFLNKKNPKFFCPSILKKSRKGVDRIVSIYWFAILILVAGGIFIMVYVFYNSPYDIRDLEAEVLASKTADCISQKGILNTELKNSGNFNVNYGNTFLESCNFNFDENSEYFVKASFFSINNKIQPVYTFDVGNKNYESFCNLQDEKDFEKLPKCLNKRFYALDDQNKQNLIEILSVVNKAEQNVNK